MRGTVALAVGVFLVLLGAVLSAIPDEKVAFPAAVPVAAVRPLAYWAPVKVGLLGRTTRATVVTTRGGRSAAGATEVGFVGFVVYRRAHVRPAMVNSSAGLASGKPNQRQVSHKTVEPSLWKPRARVFNRILGSIANLAEAGGCELVI